MMKGDLVVKFFLVVCVLLIPASGGMLSDEVGDAEFIISTSFTRHYWKSIERHDQALLHISRHLARRGGLPQADRTPGEPAGVAAAASVGVKSTMRPGNRKPSGRQGSVSRRLLDHGAR
ncbi:hypothetical protein MPTK1_4g08670 [Marchantia polymorpha subsp. ruderalis]|uniref:Secreted protein n=2 Tax=Marchantia polymorpha TaxID=3197 RepID=A0AAF6B7U2_MARPO|nr:hypothetical protein MARPO_0157s0012 [Marchantia polymorpha]BBN08076.1 hypothetical protein Mp_4g08670 [Marchantia polymorpha subsp. ruderalis]|eukprot:PTQ28680.1 hypothetical protein MARPO_0157s0012 [Marchantia polymorpha]